MCCFSFEYAQISLSSDELVAAAKLPLLLHGFTIGREEKLVLTATKPRAPPRPLKIFRSKHAETHGVLRSKEDEEGSDRERGAGPRSLPPTPLPAPKRPHHVRSEWRVGETKALPLRRKPAVVAASAEEDVDEDDLLAADGLEPPEVASGAGCSARKACANCETPPAPRLLNFFAHTK